MRKQTGQGRRAPVRRPWAALLILGSLASSAWIAPSGQQPAAARATLGQAAPDFRLVNSQGAPVGLKDFRGRKRVALAFCPSPGRAGDSLLELRSLAAAAGDLAKLNTVILVIGCDPPGFHRAPGEKAIAALALLDDPDRAVTKLYGAFDSETHTAQRATFFIDEQGVLRAAERPANPATRGRDLAGLVEQWLSGKALYEGACARCHGPDGGDTESYAGIKSLRGIGGLHDEKEILELTAMTGIVNIQAWSEPDRQALAKYVKGL